MSLFINLTLNGVTNGMIFAAVALGLVFIWRATHIVNFGQGSMAMFTTYLAVTLLDRQVNYWLAFAAALVAGLVMGAVVETVLIRPLRGKPALNPVIVTLGLFILLEGMAGSIFGIGNRSFPPAFSQAGLTFGHTKVAFSHFDVFILAAVVVLMLGTLALFRATSLGLRMRAAAFAPEVARLLGVRVGRILTLGWALAAVAGSLAGLLVAPTVSFSPNFMDLVLVYALHCRGARRSGQPGRCSGGWIGHRPGPLLCGRVSRIEPRAARGASHPDGRALRPTRRPLLPA